MKAKLKMKTKTKAKTKMKAKMENKMKTKTKIKIKMNVCFCFHFVFHFRFCFCLCFLKVLAVLSTPRGGLEVPQIVNCLLVFLEVPWHFRLRILHFAQQCHRWSTPSSLAQKCHSTQKYGTQPNSNMQNSMMLFTLFVFDRKYHFWAHLL